MIARLAAKVALLYAAWQGLAGVIADAGENASVQLTQTERNNVQALSRSFKRVGRPRVANCVAATGRRDAARVDLPEILLEVHAWTGFLDACAHISGAGPRMKYFPLPVAAVLIAEPCNVGLTLVIGEGHPALTRDRLGHVQANYARAKPTPPQIPF